MRCLHRRFLSLGLVFLAASASLAARAAGKIDFAAKIQPVFAARCAGCHGADKQQGKLRLDSAEEIGKFGEDTLLVAGKPEESELFRRITLPADDNKRMPKQGDPLSAEEIALIRQWITEGATLTAAAAPPADKPAESAPPRTPGEEAPELANVPPASAEAIAKIEAAGGTVMPLFTGSSLLQVSFAQAASPPGDDAVAALAGAAEQIVWLNLAKAQVSAAGLAPLAQLKNLIQLHLEQSSVDDAGLAPLAGLSRLEYLNIYGTAITDAGVEHLKGLSKLYRLYVWQTKISYDAAMALQAAIPGLEVNLGWDHPMVAKVRVTKELESAKAIAATAASRAAELEQQFKAANEAKAQAETRVKELEEQIKGFEAAAAPAAAQAAAEPAQAPAESAEKSAETVPAADNAAPAEAAAPAEDAEAKDADENAEGADAVTAEAPAKDANG
jgi:mono/diheme cytochrome c family protein